MNSEVPQIPELNLSSSQSQDSQEKSVESTSNPNQELSSSKSVSSTNTGEDLTQSSAESPSKSKDSDSVQSIGVKSAMDSDAWLDKTENTSPAIEEEESASFVDNWLDELDVNQNNTPAPKETDSFSNQSNKSDSETKLFMDSNVDKSESESLTSATETQVEELNATVKRLQQQKETLTAEIRTLEERKQQILDRQLREIQENLGKMVEEGIEQLKERKNTLQREVDKLERRQERIRQEMRTNFAGASQELAIRVQGFKDYLVGSLQDLAAAAEQLQLPNLEAKTQPPARQMRETQTTQASPSEPRFTEQGFVEQAKRVRQLIDKYRSRPDYYGPPWQLRRTFEPIHAERVQDWFFSQGGKGAIKSMGSRLQNILVASAIISILYHVYGDRSRVLILIDTPERLGEWRRGLQDCLGIARSDFGANRGIVLFESPEVLVQRADRLLQEKLLPLVIIDETEELVNLSLLQFPLWLAFAPEPQPATSSYLY